jgi:hypothetical protein
LNVTPEGGDTFIEFSPSPNTFVNTGKTLPSAKQIVYSMYISGTVYLFTYSASYSSSILANGQDTRFMVSNSMFIWASSLNDPFTIRDTQVRLPVNLPANVPYLLGNKLWIWGGSNYYLTHSNNPTDNFNYFFTWSNTVPTSSVYTASVNDPFTWGYAGVVKYYDNPRGQPIDIRNTNKGSRIIQAGSYLYQIMGKTYRGLPATTSYQASISNPLRWDLMDRRLQVPNEKIIYGPSYNPSFATFTDNRSNQVPTAMRSGPPPVWRPWRNPIGQMFEVNGTLLILPGEVFSDFYGFNGAYDYTNQPGPVPTPRYICTYPTGGMFSASAVASTWTNISQWSASKDTPYYYVLYNGQHQPTLNITRSTLYGRRETYGKNMVAIGDKFYQVGGYTYHHDLNLGWNGVAAIYSASAGTFTGSVLNPFLPFTSYGQLPRPVAGGEALIAPYSGTYYTILYGGWDGGRDPDNGEVGAYPIFLNTIYAEAITGSIVTSSRVIDYGATPSWKVLANKASTPSTTSIAVAAAGTGSLSYQWYSGSTALVNSSTYSGSKTPTLKIYNPEEATGSYWVSVNSSLGPYTTSSLVSVTTSSSAINVSSFAFGDVEA